MVQVEFTGADGRSYAGNPSWRVDSLIWIPGQDDRTTSDTEKDTGTRRQDDKGVREQRWRCSPLEIGLQVRLASRYVRKGCARTSAFEAAWSAWHMSEKKSLCALDRFEGDDAASCLGS